MDRRVRWVGLFLFLILLLSVTGCHKDGANKNIDPYHFYNQVKLGASKEEIDLTLGIEGQQEESSAIYIDSNNGFGVDVVYDVNNTVTMKTLYHDNEKEIMALSDARVDESLNDLLSEGMAYEDVKDSLGGDGTEIIQVMNPVDPNKAIYVRIWFNPDQTGVYASFLGERGHLINAVYYK